MFASLRISRHGNRFYLVMGSLILAAWGFLVIWQQSPFAEWMGHEGMNGHHDPLLRYSGFLLSWFLMTVAMMLPGTLPMLNHAWAASSRFLGLTVLGYLFPWLLVGMFIYQGDAILHHLAEPGAALASLTAWFPPAIVLLTGLYQFTPVKQISLLRCRSSHWVPGMDGVDMVSRWRAWIEGIHMGGFCIGSCWSLMLLMFAIGHHRLDLMLILSGIMAAERLTPWGRRLTWLVGFALIIWAVLWVVGTSGSGHSHA